jgi:exopolysaccharide biosynthesis polyprenyl glycosylphosphotransferase
MHRRIILLNCLKLFDTTLMLVSFGFSTLVVSSNVEVSSFESLLVMRVRLPNLAIFIGFMIAWHMIFSFFKLYQSRRLSSVHEEVADIIKATAAGAAVLLLGALVFNIRLVTPTFLASFWASTTSCLMLSRLALRFLLRQIRSRGRNLRNVIIAGTNSRALAFAKKIESSTDLGYMLKGFVDDEVKNKEIGTGRYSLVARLDNLPEFLRRNVVDEVVIALPIKSYYAQAASIVATCEEQGIMARCLSDLFNVHIAKTEAELIDGQAITTISTSSPGELALFVKRLVDILGSSVLLLLASPLLLLAAGLIKASSRGPAFFTQDRLGINKHLFKLIKFRTMVSDAEKKIHELEYLNEVKGPVFKIKNDPRITGIGKYLRKTSIDELPQLFNVLKGDMSLVGPRPLPVRDYNGFNEDWHRRRFSVRPGITCLWQCKGRNNVSFDRWMQMDMEYIDTWSLGLDVKILLMTIPAVVRGSGAA